MLRHTSFVVVLFSLTASAFGWSASGHEATALIAWDQLTPAVRAKLITVLEAHKLRDRDLLNRLQPGEKRDVTLFITAATWPDIVKTPGDPMNFTENHPTWHYVDFPIDKGVNGPEPEEKWDGKSNPANLLEAMQKLTAEFADPVTKPDRQAIDLCWIEHLVGDIHQPLHAASLFSKDFPQGDRGGNSYLASIGGHIIALHGYWDGMEGRGTGETYIRKVANRIEKDFPPANYANQLKPDDVLAWAKESQVIAEKTVYATPGVPRSALKGGGRAPVAPANYDAIAHKTADERIALGGYRLAAMLTELAGKLPAPATTQPTADR